MLRYENHVIRCCMHVYTYEFFDNRKVKMVLLPRGLCQVNVKRFHLGISLWHELSKSATTQGFVEQVELLLVSLQKAREWSFPRGVVAEERYSG